MKNETEHEWVFQDSHIFYDEDGYLRMNVNYVLLPVEETEKEKNYGKR